MVLCGTKKAVMNRVRVKDMEEEQKKEGEAEDYGGGAVVVYEQMQ